MFIKDVDCTKETPVVLGHPDKVVYWKKIKMKPRIEGRRIVNTLKKYTCRNYYPLRSMI